jgi:hypothetical protein
LPRLPQEPQISIADPVAKLVCPTENSVLYQRGDQLEVIG